MIRNNPTFFNLASQLFTQIFLTVGAWTVTFDIYILKRLIIFVIGYMIQLLIPFSLFLTRLDNLIKKYLYPLFLIHFNNTTKFLWPLHNWYIVYSIKSLWNLNKNFIYLTNGISILNRDRRESAPPVLIPSVNDNFDSKIYDITWKEHLIFLYYHKPFLKFAIKYWIYLLSTIIIWNWFWKANRCLNYWIMPLYIWTSLLLFEPTKIMLHQTGSFQKILRYLKIRPLLFDNVLNTVRVRLKQPT